MSELDEVWQRAIGDLLKHDRHFSTEPVSKAGGTKEKQIERLLKRFHVTIHPDWWLFNCDGIFHVEE